MTTTTTMTTMKDSKKFDELKDVVRRLQCDDGDDEIRRRRMDVAAADVRRLAKDDFKARETLSMLGAIPPLVAMLAVDDDLRLQISALYALLNLSVANNLNKAMIVEAGVLKKMESLISPNKTPPPFLSEAIVANFLGLSALDRNKSPIGSTPNAIHFLVATFLSPISTSQSKHDSLRALFNLSLALSNTPYFLSLVPSLISSIGDSDATDRILSILSNLVSTPEGRGAIVRANESFAVLIDVLNWNDEPSCQEKAVYVLMVLGHRSYCNQAAMVENGIVSCLLELSLIGTPIAQKRSTRVLEFLRIDPGKLVSEGFDNGCGSGRFATKEDLGNREVMKAVRELVQMSLRNNLKIISKRANLPNDLYFVPSEHFKSVVGVTAVSTPSSRSLPLV